MAQWHHLFGLLSVLCMSFGALYIVFNSDFNEVCDYADTVDSCSDLKTYQRTDPAWEQKRFENQFLVHAQELRNKSEIEKCELERELLQGRQDVEKEEAEKIVQKCMEDFRACVEAGYTTTSPPPQQVDCTACNRFCKTSKWTDVDEDYAAAMNFTGTCSATVCPWLPECGVGNLIHTKCSMRGCPCEKAQCSATTTIKPAVVIAPIVVTTTTMEPTTAAPPGTAAATMEPTTITTTTDTTTITTTITQTTTATTATTATTTSGPTTTTTTVTTTTITSTTTTTFTTTQTTLTTTTSTVTTTTMTTTTISTTTITTTTLTTTTVTTIPGSPPTTTVTTAIKIGCYCPVGSAGIVLVGRPYKTFYEVSHAFTQKTIEYWQGVHVETNGVLPLGGQTIQGCGSYFSNRSRYAGPRGVTGTQQRAQAMANHFDLSCGYSGQFTIMCSQSPAEKLMGTCSLTTDISTCKPPTYSQALDDCYAAPATTTFAPLDPSMPTVPDWLGVEEINFTLAELPPFFNITTQTTTPYPCCEVHVGSVCRPDINFMTPAETIDGRWQPSRSYSRQDGYFATVPCDQQAKSTPRACPRVRIKEISTAHTQWPQCHTACNQQKVEDEFMEMCNRTAHPEVLEEEIRAHQKKIDSMKGKASELEGWVASRMATVVETKEVIDCFADRLPRRYNAMALPKMRTGFEKMPLHNECRLHGCEAKQCLVAKKPCKIPFVHEAPEALCNVFRDSGSFECVEKITIWTNNPMSLYFGIAWMVIGVIFCSGAVVSFIRQLGSGDPSGAGRGSGRPRPGEAPTLSLANP